MPNIKPFRDYSEHEVTNLFAYDGTNVSKGTFVKISTGWKTDDELQLLGPVGASYQNSVSQRYGIAARVTAAASGDAPIGMLLYDVKDVDENGELLIYNPRKQAEMGVTQSGQAAPILNRGKVLYSGIAGTPTLGGALYVAAGGALSVTGLAAEKVGRALGLKDPQGYCLIQIAL